MNVKKLMEVAAVAFAAAVARGETYSSMEVDVSTLPRERAFLRGLLLSRAWDRTPPSDAAGRLTVRFENDSLDRCLSDLAAYVRSASGNC